MRGGQGRDHLSPSRHLFGVHSRRAGVSGCCCNVHVSCMNCACELPLVTSANLGNRSNQSQVNSSSAGSALVASRNSACLLHSLCKSASPGGISKRTKTGEDHDLCMQSQPLWSQHTLKKSSSKQGKALRAYCDHSCVTARVCTCPSAAARQARQAAQQRSSALSAQQSLDPHL